MVKTSADNVGDPGLIPGSGRSPEEGNGNPFQYSCLENPMDRGAQQATVHRVTKSRTQLNDFTFTFREHIKNQRHYFANKGPSSQSYGFFLGFHGGSDGKASACNAGDPGSIPGSGRSPEEGNGNPLQYPCLENLMDTGASWAAVHGVIKSQA